MLLVWVKSNSCCFFGCWFGVFPAFVSSPPNGCCLSMSGEVQTMKEVMCCEDSKSGMKQAVIMQPCLDKSNKESESCGKLVSSRSFSPICILEQKYQLLCLAHEK